jgi:hypothetical protein
MVERHKAADEAQNSDEPGKLRWERPTIEEMDFSAAESGPGPYTYSDFSTYS